MSDNLAPEPEESGYGQPKRTDNDLDSITVGSPSKKQIKIYFDSRVDDLNDMYPRVDMLLSLASYMENKLAPNKKEE